MFRINVNNNFHTDASQSAPQLLEELSSRIFKELPPVLGETEARALSPQHGLVLQQLARQLALIGQTKAALDGKITTILGIGGLIVALTAGSSLAGLLGGPTPLSAGGILLVFGAFFLIVALIGFPSMPQDHLAFKGGTGKQRIYDAYIRADFEDSYDRVLSDYLRAIETMMNLTRSKNRVVRLAVLLFLLEITGLFMAVLGS